MGVDRKEEKPVSNRKLLRKILRLKSLKITCFWFMHREKELHLAVKPYKNGCRCPACGRRGRIVHQTTELRRWEDIALIGTRVLLWYAPKEIGYIRMSQLTKCAEDAVSSRFRRLSQGTQMAGNTRRNIEVTDGQIDHVGEVV